MSGEDHSISIWYFIGLLLAVYGILILGYGIHEWMNPPEARVVLFEMHASIWWGALMLAIGGVYIYLFSPRRRR